jgi:hypothetical protein
MVVLVRLGGGVFKDTRGATETDETPLADHCAVPFADKSRKIIPSALSQDSGPIKLFPLLLESIYSSIMAFVPSALPLDYIWFQV